MLCPVISVRTIKLDSVWYFVSGQRVVVVGAGQAVFRIIFATRSRAVPRFGEDRCSGVCAGGVAAAQRVGGQRPALWGLAPGGLDGNLVRSRGKAVTLEGGAECGRGGSRKEPFEPGHRGRGTQVLRICSSPEEPEVECV